MKHSDPHRLHGYVFASVALLLCSSAHLPGQNPKAVPPTHSLSPALATTTVGAVSSIAALRATGSGNVFINDVIQRRVVLLDSTLTVRRVVADTTTVTRRLYGWAATGLFGYRGDTTLFLDGSALSIAVLNADGDALRVMAPPRISDFGQLVGGSAGIPGLDGEGRLVYRGQGINSKEQLRRGRAGETARSDSVPLVRFDFALRRLDTVTILQSYTPAVTMLERELGGAHEIWMIPVLHPAPVIDDWAVMPSGTIAVVRGRDFHVDLYSGSSRPISGPKVPFAWRPLTDADKVALIDSSRALKERLFNEGISTAVNVAPVPGLEPVSSTSVTISSDSRSPIAARKAPETNYVSPSDLPDYQPAFATGGLRADAAGRLWVRIIPPVLTAEGPVYDVLDTRGALLDRIEVPRGTAIAGFGPNDSVYLAVREKGSLRLERRRYSAPR